MSLQAILKRGTVTDFLIEMTGDRCIFGTRGTENGERGYFVEQLKG